MRLLGKGNTKHTILAVRATIQESDSARYDRQHADSKQPSGRKAASPGNVKSQNRIALKLRLDSPPAPRVLRRDKFMLVIQKHALNFPMSMATQFWDVVGRGNVLDVTRFLCSLRLLVNCNTDPCVSELGSRATESIETKLDGLFKIYEKHCGKVDKLEQVFTIAAKSWEERKAIHDLLEKRFFPAITAIMHERDQFSGSFLTSDALPGIILTQEIFNDALRRCPDLVAEFLTQLNHPTIRNGDV